MIGSHDSLKEGKDITGAVMPAGGSSGRGWLSAIWLKITGLFRAEDSASVGGEDGIPVLVVRNDAAIALTDLDGDFSFIAVDAAGRIGVTTLGGTFTVDTELPPAAALGDGGSASPNTVTIGAELIGRNYDTDVQKRLRTVGVGILTVAPLTSDGGSIFASPLAAADSIASPTTTQIMGMNMVWDGSDWDRERSVQVGDAAGVGLSASGQYVFNGTTWDRARSASASHGGVTGVPGAAILAWDGSEFRRLTMTDINGLDVDVTRSVLPTGAATETTLALAATSLAVMDDWGESDRAKVNPIVGIAGVAAGAGASSTSTQRTVTATDSPDVTALQVMDDWDEADRAKVNPIVGQAGIQGGAGAATASTTRVTIDSAQVTALTPPSAITGYATSANQATEITSLQLIDDAVNAQDTALSKGVPIFGQFDDASTATVAENNTAAVRITSARALHVAVQNTVTVSGSAAASLIKYEMAVGQELRVVDTIGADRYHARNTDTALTSAATWEAVRFYRDAAGNITRTRYRTGVTFDTITVGW